jgi:hypothetical protein
MATMVLNHRLYPSRCYAYTQRWLCVLCATVASCLHWLSRDTGLIGRRKLATDVSTELSKLSSLVSMLVFWVVSQCRLVGRYINLKTQTVI